MYSDRDVKTLLTQDLPIKTEYDPEFTDRDIALMEECIAFSHYHPSQGRSFAFFLAKVAKRMDRMLDVIESQQAPTVAPKPAMYQSGTIHTDMATGKQYRVFKSGLWEWVDNP